MKVTGWRAGGAYITVDVNDKGNDRTILDVKQIMSASEESELRERLRETEKHLSVHQRLAAALMEPKPWVGLTDDEIWQEWSSPKDSASDFARAIEAKLKEKNRGEK